MSSSSSIENNSPPSSAESLVIISTPTTSESCDLESDFSSVHSTISEEAVELTESYNTEDFLFEFDDVGCCLDENGSDYIRKNRNDYRYDAISNYPSDDDEEEEDEEVEALRMLQKGEQFLVYLAVPVLLSQLLMIFILTSTTNASKTLPVVHVVHVHEFRHNFYFLERPSTNQGSSGFFYYFFNPLAILFNSKYFKWAASWVSEHSKAHKCDPQSLLEQAQSCFGSMRVKAGGLIEKEIGVALELRDSWNKAIIERISRVTASPTYQRAISSISKWSSTLKKEFFS